MAQIGNKKNAYLNSEYARHVRKWYKRFTSGLRRSESKEIIRKEMDKL